MSLLFFTFTHLVQITGASLIFLFENYFILYSFPLSPRFFFCDYMLNTNPIWIYGPTFSLQSNLVFLSYFIFGLRAVFACFISGFVLYASCIICSLCVVFLYYILCVVFSVLYELGVGVLFFSVNFFLCVLFYVLYEIFKMNVYACCIFRVVSFLLY